MRKKKKPLNTQKLLVVQRLLTPYRYELLVKLAPYFKSVTIVSSFGETTGALRAAHTDDIPSNVKILWLHSLKIPYIGESRSWSFFLYPQSVLRVPNADILLLEGTSNFANNSYIVPLARILGKKIVWWDAGYSPPRRTKRRIRIDALLTKYIRLTNKQIAYSSKAKEYMEKYMGAKDCTVVLNTISTTYYEDIRDEVIESVKNHHIDKKSIKLLYVGAVEERKRVLDLIKLIAKINTAERQYELVIIGDGNDADNCKRFIDEHEIDNVRMVGRIYEKEQLKAYYLSADLFVMPGDGGLAIAQSLLFGLPAVCIASDGTECDYMDDQRYILDSIDQLGNFLKKFSDDYDRYSTLNAFKRLKDRSFISSMLAVLES